MKGIRGDYIKSLISQKAQSKYDNFALNYLMQFNGKVISYNIQKQIESKLLLNNTKQVLDTFKRLGFWITWLDCYKGNGKRIYKVSKMKDRE